MKQVTSWFLFAFCLAIAHKKAMAAGPFDHSRQCLVVITESWSATSGQMFLLERSPASSWQPQGSPIPVQVGKSGLAWGRGLTSTESLPGPVKKEGDEKAPAGVFRLGSAFGHASEIETRSTKMPYLALSEKNVAVDDSRSRYYNQIVDKSAIERPDWRSAEEMFGVNVYKWGIVVEHNIPPEAGAGSCIFLHVWESPTTPTSGCTAMGEQDVVKLLRWLDPARGPLLVQLPRGIYNDLRVKWNLPDLMERAAPPATPKPSEGGSAPK